MASLPFLVVIGGGLCVLAVAFWGARHMEFAGAITRNRPAPTSVSFVTDRDGPPMVKSSRRVLAPERASVARRRGRQHAVSLPI